MEEPHSFPLVETSEITQLTLHHHPDGKILVRWEDIEQAFPGVSPVHNGISVISFHRGADYQRINQCSRSMEVVLSTSIQPLPIKSGPVGDQTNSPIGVSVATSVSNTDPVSGIIAKATPLKPTQTSRRTPDAQEESLSFLIPEEQELTHSSAKSLKDGHQEQEQDALAQKIEASAVKNSKLQEEVCRLQKEMSANLEAMKQLESQVLSNQEEIKELQLQTRNPIGVLRSRVQAILNQNYELHEYPISRLFVVLPQDPSVWDALNPFSNKFRLYFLCECGEHTKSIKSTGPHEIHFAKHQGYEITRPSEFFQRYGLYTLTILKMLKVGISVAGVTVPALFNLFPSDTIGKARISLTQLRDNIEQGMDQIIGLMDKISVNGGKAIDEFGEDIEKKEMLEGVDLRKLGAFLKIKDDNKVLGNLYRTVTDEGHVKWVCIDHYRVKCKESQAKEFQRVLKSIGGWFNRRNGKVVVRIDSSMMAERLYSALGQASSVYELDINLDWACTAHDLETLERALRNSRVSVLRLDLQQFRTSAVSQQLSTPTHYEVIYHIRDLPQVKAFHIVLSEDNIKFPGISSNVSTHASKISCELKLKAIERDRREIGILAEALKTNSNLTALDLTGNNIEVEGAEALAEALKTNSTLTTLILEDSDIGVEGAKALAEALNTNSTLTTLDLEDSDIGVDGAKALAEALKSNSTLINLDLDSNNIRDNGADVLAEALKINSTLTYLGLSSNNIESGGAKALAEALKSNSTLTKLYLDRNNIRDNGAEVIAEALKINSTLITLDLSFNSIGDDGAKALAWALKINSTLTPLGLRSNNIESGGAKALAEALMINSTLTTLDIFDNSIGDDGAKSLARALTINSTLTYLGLSFNSIGDDGAKALAEALKINSTLTSLYLNSNNIGEDGAKALAEVRKINSTVAIVR